MLGEDSPSRVYYESYWSPTGFSPTVAGLPERLREILAGCVGPTDAVIDVGCGDGSKAGPWLTANALAYTGFDVSATAVELARTRGLVVQRIDDASALPLSPQSVDAAVCLEVLEHLFDPYGAVTEINRVLRPGGKLIVTVPNVANWRSRVDFALLGRWHPGGDARSVAEPWRDPHIRFFTPGILAAMLESAGYKLEQLGALEELSVLHRVPKLHRALRDRRAGPVTELLGKLTPGAFGTRLYAVATRPAT